MLRLVHYALDELSSTPKLCFSLLRHERQLFDGFRQRIDSLFHE